MSYMCMRWLVNCSHRGEWHNLTNIYFLFESLQLPTPMPDTDKYFDPDQSSTFQVVGCNDCSGGSHCEHKDAAADTAPLDGSDGSASPAAIGGATTASGERCIFTQSYTEGSSWMAYQAIDEFFAGPAMLPDQPNYPKSEEDKYINHHDFSIPFMFGCQISETGLFVTQLADGIMGMSAHEATLPKKLHEAGKIKRNLFTLCFRNSLTVEKEGINAGLMTIGGVDGRLHSTPMVYARNVARSGWYTIYCSNVYLRTNGGQGAASDDPSRQHIMKIPVSAEEMNSGKGVIVDSGTTDTYLHKSIAGVFGEAWKAVTGKSYSNSAVRLTRSELLRLPTVLLQIRSYDGPAPDYDLDEGGLAGGLSPPGLVGPQLSPQSPSDILLAIPATHYMEYSAAKDVYTSRLYFTESRGGVLGANAMQGHNVLFDWENGRVGFAESTCAYADDNDRSETEEALSKENLVKKAKLKQRRDCELGPPVLTITCAESISRDDPNILHQCGSDMSKELPGRETWSRVVEVDGLGGGRMCMEVMANVARGGSDPAINPYLPQGGGGRKLMMNEVDDDTTVECDPLTGLCHAITSCSTTCGEAQKASQILSDSFQENSLVPLPGHPSLDCGDNLWGSCTSECKQGRLPSFFDNTGTTKVTSNSPLGPTPGVPQAANGVCVSHPSHVEIRDCHIDSCGRHDPCRVPFVVHAILAFRGADLASWHRHYEQGFASALQETINRGRHKKHQLFEVGDVDMLMVGPWHNKDDGEEAAWLEEVGGQNNPQNKVAPVDERPDSSGIKVVFEISIFNENANKPVDENQGKRMKLKGLADKLHMVTRSTTLSTCSETDFYPLSQRALDIHMELGRSTFISKLVDDLKAQEQLDGSDAQSPFLPLFQIPLLVDQSQLVTSWTIKTEPNGRGGVHEHYRDASYRSKGAFMYYLTSPRFWFGILMLGMSLFTFYQNMSDDEDEYDDGSTIASSIRTAPARAGARRGGSGATVASATARARNTRGTVGQWTRRRYAQIPSYDNATVA